jgi:hypothetical protein
LSAFGGAATKQSQNYDVNYFHIALEA